MLAVSNNDLVLTVVPEPSTATLLGAGVGVNRTGVALASKEGRALESSIADELQPIADRRSIHLVLCIAVVAFGLRGTKGSLMVVARLTPPAENLPGVENVCSTTNHESDCASVTEH